MYDKTRHNDTDIKNTEGKGGGTKAAAWIRKIHKA